VICYVVVGEVVFGSMLLRQSFQSGDSFLEVSFHLLEATGIFEGSARVGVSLIGIGVVVLATVVFQTLCTLGTVAETIFAEPKTCSTGVTTVQARSVTISSTLMGRSRSVAVLVHKFAFLVNHVAVLVH